MSYYRGVARDEYGNALYEAQVSVFTPDTSTLSTIYSDAELATPLVNPFSTGADGVYEFYAAPGYYDVQVAKTGFSTVLLQDQVLGSVMGMAYGADLGQKVSAGSVPNIIGNTNLGAAHLVLQYESAFDVDVDTGLWTYQGNPTIIVECIAKAMYTDTVGSKTLITRIYRDKGGARELEVGKSNVVTDTTVNLGSTVYGVVELQKNDTIGFYFSVGSGTATVDTHDGSFYSVKRIG